MRKTSLLALAVLALVVIPVCKKAPTMKYPVTAKVDQVDDYFGTQVADPYRWLEDDTLGRDRGLGQGPERGDLRLPGQDPLPRGAQEAADRHLQLPPLLVALPGRRTLLLRQERRAAEPVRDLRPEGPGRRARSVHRPQRPFGRRHDPGRAARPLRRQEARWPSRAARRARTGPRSGSWTSPPKRSCPTSIKWVKFSGAAWWKDGFFYSGYDKPEAGKELTAKNEFQKIFYHKLGDPQEKDLLVFEDKDHPLRYFGVGVSEDEKYAFLTVSEGTSGTELYWRTWPSAAPRSSC